MLAGSVNHTPNFLVRTVSHFRSYPWWTQCVLMWFGVLLLLNGTGLVGSRIFEPGPSSHACDNEHQAFDEFPGTWRRWDACFYIEIANHGYIPNSDTAGFFPLYPLLIATVQRVTGITMELAGILVSNFSFLGSTLILYKLARLVKDDHGFALRSVLAMLVFPTSFFYFAIYAESLYLLFALLGVYLAMKKYPTFIGSGLALGISSIARPVGWLIDLVLLGELIRKKRFDIKSILSLGLGSLFSILGVILYVYYLYVVLGTFSAIPEAQSHWPRQWQLPWITYFEGLRTLSTPTLLHSNWFAYAMNAVDLFFTSFTAIIILMSFARARRNEFPWSLSVYAFVTFLFFLSSQNELPSPLWGMTRWMASLFPIYFVLGNLFKNRKSQALYYIASIVLLICFTAWWTSGRWIG